MPLSRLLTIRDTTKPALPASRAPRDNTSLLIKPLKGRMPIIDKEATVKTLRVMGIS